MWIRGLLVGNCWAFLYAKYGGLGRGNSYYNKKTINDHIVSFSTGKNCSTVRKNTGRHYCEEDEVVTPDEVYCYPTLGDISCYARPSPHGEKSPSLGQIKPNARAPR